MPTFIFERIKGREISIDKSSLSSKSESEDFARKLLKKNLNFNKVVITQIKPNDKFRTIIERP